MRINLLIIIAICCVIRTNADSITNLVVWTTDGDKVAYALSEKPKVTFSDEYLVISADDMEVKYEIEKMSRITYESVDMSEITDIESNDKPFKIGQNLLVFPDMKANSVVSIYALDGTLVFVKAVDCNGEYAFPLAKLRAGVYLVNVNGVTYKIEKR